MFMLLVIGRTATEVAVLVVMEEKQRQGAHVRVGSCVWVIVGPGYLSPTNTVW